MACYSTIVGSGSSPSILKSWTKLSLTVKSNQLYMALYGLLRISVELYLTSGLDIEVGK